MSTAECFVNCCAEFTSKCTVDSDLQAVSWPQDQLSVMTDFSASNVLASRPVVLSWLVAEYLVFPSSCESKPWSKQLIECQRLWNWWHSVTLWKWAVPFPDRSKLEKVLETLGFGSWHQVAVWCPRGTLCDSDADGWVCRAVLLDHNYNSKQCKQPHS